MSLAFSLGLLAVVLITATVSGVFGVAGGLMLMGAMTLAMPVAAATVTHGAMQFVSNGWRAVLRRRHMRRADGSFRDTAWFSVLREDWPTVKAGSEARLAAFR